MIPDLKGQEGRGILINKNNNILTFIKNYTLILASRAEGG